MFTEYYKLLHRNFIYKVELKKHKDIKSSIAIPLDVDTEYRPIQYDLINNKIIPRLIVSVQVKHGLLDDPTLYITKDYHNYLLSTGNTDKIKNKVFYKENILEQYLIDKGYRVSVDKHILAHKLNKNCLLVVYAHFALADINNIFNYDITELYKDKEIYFKNRLMVNNRVINLDRIITINDEQYNLQLKIVDTAVLAGNQSLASLAEKTGTEIKYKKLLDDYKTKMHLAYIERYEDFINYSLGDLVCYKILLNHNKMYRETQKQLQITTIKDNKKLSVGSTVNQLLTNKFLQAFNLESTEDIKTPSPKLLSEIKSKSCLLAKVFGGRCINNNPLYTTSDLDSLFNDIDLSGAYATTMQVSDVVQGLPVIAGLRQDVHNNHGLTIKKFLKYPLLDRKWVAVINTVENLKYDQDLIPSWIDYKPEDVRSGNTKIFLRQIKDGIITSDILDVINSWSKVHRNNFYKKVRIIAFQFYPSTQTFKNNLKTEHWQVEYTKCNKYRIYNFGKLIVDDFIKNRNKYPKGTPKEQLYKLFGNTTYGVSVSNFFESTNTILANNITAMCRCMMYMLEKSLNLVGSITDGQHVKLFNIPTFIGNKSQYYARLYQYSRAELNKLKICTFDKFTNIMHMDKLLEKVRSDFNVKLLHEDFITLQFTDLTIPAGLHKIKHKGLFNLEIKNRTATLTMHSSANYLVQDKFSHKTILKYRSGQKTNYKSFTYEDNGELKELETYKKSSPHLQLLTNIRNDSTKCPILPIAYKTTILKTKKYLISKIYKNSMLRPSDNIPSLVVLNYFSLSTFKFNTYEQYKLWVKADTKLKTKYSSSFDMFFINKDGSTINYKLMLQTIDDMITNNVTNIIKYLDKHNHVSRYNKIITKRHNDKIKLKSRIENLILTTIDIDYKQTEDDDNKEG